MTRISYAVLVVMGFLLISGCAISGSDRGQSGLTIAGDEKGGTIPRSVGVAATQSSAYKMIDEHCAKFGKKGFITRMDFESGTMTFVCVLRKAPNT